ncbi:DUF7507 domain-containing protein, partial [Flavobacterium sp.]|uniref:DUF7507 domain-containing protein n=1 Tax=Flavobacterium sp. TaxID=239 RepID=UPI003C44FD50
VKNIAINDAKLGQNNLAIIPSTLAPLEVGVITQDYAITQADIDLGVVTNTAIASGKDPQNLDIQDTSGTAIDNDISTITNLPRSGKLAFVKTGVYNGSISKAKVGDKITYTFKVTNTGNLIVTNIFINDPVLGLASLPLIPFSLAPAGTGEVTQEYTITQADIDAGTVVNTAVAKGQDLLGNDVEDKSGTAVDNDDSTITNLPQSGTLAFVKTGVYGGDVTKAKVNDKITYTFKVINTGNLTVKDIVVNDIKLGVTNLAIVPSTLAPTESGEITQEYAITQADIDAGKVVNTAIATGKDPQNKDVEDTSGTTVDNNDSTVTNLPQTGTLAFVKTAVYNGDATKAKVNDKITYTFTVTNTGNVTIDNIIINDPKLGITNLAIVPPSLAPTKVGEITQEYTVTQADIDAGLVSNTATAIGQDPQGVNIQDTSGTAVDNDNSTITSLPVISSITLVETATILGAVEVGGPVKFTFAISNTGNTTISNISITSALAGINIPNNIITSLAPGETNNSVTGDYSIKQLDLDNGRIVDYSVAVGKDPLSNDVSSISSTGVGTATITQFLIQVPAVSLTKNGVWQDTNLDGITSVDDKIIYSFEVGNIGNIGLTNLMVTDAKVTVQGAMIAYLGVNDSNSTAFTAEYLITQDDIDKGYVYNSAQVDAIGSNGDPITETSTATTICVGCPVDPSCLTCTITPLPQSPKIALMMTGVFGDTNGDGQAQKNETINYTYTVMNLGNVPLSTVWIEDITLGHDVADGFISLPIGATDYTTFSATYHITQEDIIRGSVTNQSKVFGTSPLGVVVQDLSDDTSPLENDPTTIPITGCNLEVFNAVSPDGDSFNSLFRIQGIDCYPNNSVQIYDRWGVKVFDVEGYDNNTKAFRGKSDGRVTINQSKGLPSGAYFYIIKYVDKNNTGFNKSGYIQLIN